MQIKSTTYSIAQSQRCDRLLKSALIGPASFNQLLNLGWIRIEVGIIAKVINIDDH